MIFAVSIEPITRVSANTKCFNRLIEPRNGERRGILCQGRTRINCECVCERERERKRERERASTRVISVKCSRYPHCHRRPKRVAGNVTGARLYLVTWYGFAGDNAKICATSLVNRNETRDFFFSFPPRVTEISLMDRDTRFSPMIFDTFRGTKSLTIRCTILWFFFFYPLFFPRSHRIANFFFFCRNERISEIRFTFINLF